MKLEIGNIDVLHSQNPERRGWFIGNFISNDSLLNSDSCEIKWAKHPKGLTKSSGKDLDESVRTCTILISGKWKCVYPESQKEVVLEKSGDYIAFDGGYHENEALEDSHVMVIRWKNKNA